MKKSNLYFVQHIVNGYSYNVGEFKDKAEALKYASTINNYIVRKVTIDWNVGEQLSSKVIKVKLTDEN